MKAIRWTASALSDLARIDEWYADFDPDYATRVGTLAIKATEFLLDYPLAGPAITSVVRKWPVSGTDYRLLYTLSADAIEVVRVIHVKEDKEGFL